MTEQLPFFRRPGALLLALAIGFLVVMIICAATPIVWILMGSPAEEYPERAFAAFGIPWAFSWLLLLVGTIGGAIGSAAIRRLVHQRETQVVNGPNHAMRVRRLSVTPHAVAKGAPTARRR